MKTAHTPGPWSQPNYNKFGLTPGKNGMMIEIINEVAPEEMIANANLIVAAPELLAALKRMTNEFLTQIQFAGQNSTLFYDCLNQAKSAISKARGEI